MYKTKSAWTQKCVFFYAGFCQCSIYYQLLPSMLPSRCSFYKSLGFPLKANVIIRQSEAKSDWKRKIQTKFYQQIRVLKSISKNALVIIENGARWLVENFALSRLSVFKMAARFVDVSEQQTFVLLCRIITSAILLKQLVTSGSVIIAIVTSTSSRWLFADIHVAFGDFFFYLFYGFFLTL